MQEQHSQRTEGTLKQRQQARKDLITCLIQATRRRQGLYLFGSNPEGEPDEEFAIEITVWERVLREVPTDYIERAYDRASIEWDWINAKKDFIPDVVLQEYRAIVQAEASERKTVHGHLRQMEKCKHDDVYEPEPGDGKQLFLGFNTCRKCGRCLPVPNPASPLRQKKGIAKQLLRVVDRSIAAAQGVNFGKDENQ